MNATHTLQQKEVYPIRRHNVRQVNRYKRIVCEKGVLWLTQTGNPGDFILMPGDQFAGRKHGKVIIEALHDAIMRIDE
jgi:hypothetical protein